jgi:cbb3-type cytochrome oxidase maturation protein
MFYLGWIVITATGIGVSIVVFLWALRTGQFSDQARARYLPLGGEFPVPSVKDPAKLPAEVYALLFVLGLGLLSLGATVFLTLFRVKG